MPNHTELKHVRNVAVAGRVIDGIEALRHGLADQALA